MAMWLCENGIHFVCVFLMIANKNLWFTNAFSSYTIMQKWLECMSWSCKYENGSEKLKVIFDSFIYCKSAAIIWNSSWAK